MAELKLEFLGGASAIGASSCLVSVGGSRVLIDCGIRFEPDRPLPDLGRLGTEALDAVFVTHAHSDHTGGLAVLHAAHPGVPIYMTAPTRELVRILQLDALKIMDAEERAKELPLYREEDVHSLLECIRPLSEGESVTVGSFRVTPLPAGHILGAAMLFMETPGGHVLFTGDFSVRGQLTVPNLRLPKWPVDVLVTETTYGNRLHLDRRISEEKLVRRIATVLEGGGRVLIPAFAIGRAQEILLILKRAIRDRRIPKVPVFADGMVRPVCDVYSRFPQSVSPILRHEINRNRHPFFGDTVQAVRPDERKNLPTPGPCVIVSSSGMLTGGPSSLYAQKMLGIEKDAIFITGYQDEESPGRALLNLAASDGNEERTLRLGGQTHPVKCQFEAFQLSAHADKNEILGLVDHLGPRCVVLVHGDLEAKRSLGEALASRVRDVVYADEVEAIMRSFSPRRIPAGARFQDSKAFAVATDSGPTAAVIERSDSQGSSPRAQTWPQAKSRLLEFVQHLKLGPVQFLTREIGARASSRVILHGRDGQTLESGSFEASSYEAAEGLAATWALLQILPEVRPEDSQKVAPGEATGRRKGELGELCSKAGVPLPEFELSLCQNGFLARVVIRFGRFEHRGPWCLAMAKKEAEFGACKLSLEALQLEAGDWEIVPFLRRHITPDLREALTTLHPTSQLSQWEQTGVIEGYETEMEATGPAHAPQFVARATATLPGHGPVSVSGVTATSKKEASKLIHGKLVAAVESLISQSDV